MKNVIDVKLSDIEAARQTLGKWLTPTALLMNPWLSERLGCKIYLKLENMQPVGSFKIRGATNKIANLSPAQKKKGVISASAGNHAQGVAWGSSICGVEATIVMPVTAPLVKVQNTRALGAKVILEGQHYDESVECAKKIAKKTKKIYIPAFEDAHVIAGQGTIGLEIFESLPDVDVIIGSLGGGGMMAGVSIAMRALRPQTQIIGCQAVGCQPLFKSFETGRAVKIHKVETFADGIAVSEAKPSMLKILRNHLDEIVVADDEAIAEAILLLLEKAKTVVEASGAITLAIAEKIAHRLKGKKVVLIMSGGNVDVNVLGRVIERGLIKAGRRVRINAWIPDVPGSLSRLTTLLAEQGVNILQAIHDRSELSTGFHETGVELTLETKGHDHTKNLLKAFKISDAVNRFEIID